MEYIISFKSTNIAIKAEQCLLSQGINVRVMPLPSQIRAGCGISLRVAASEIDTAVKMLYENNIDEIGLFTREQECGKYIYCEVKI